MKHLYFVQNSKGFWIPGGLYEDKGQAIDDAAMLSVRHGKLVRAPMGSKLRWVHPRHKEEKALQA